MKSLKVVEYKIKREYNLYINIHFLHTKSFLLVVLSILQIHSELHIEKVNIVWYLLIVFEDMNMNSCWQCGVRFHSCRASVAAFFFLSFFIFAFLIAFFNVFHVFDFRGNCEFKVDSEFCMWKNHKALKRSHDHDVLRQSTETHSSE